MAALPDLARDRAGLTSPEIDHLHRLVADWQIFADLSFADLLLFAPVAGRDAFVILAQVRPYPAQTLYQEDMVGRVVQAADRPRVAAALAERRIVREGEPEWRAGTPVREQAVPVAFEGRIVAVVSAEENLATARTPSRLEMSYLQAAADLARMIAEGEFPFRAEEVEEREIWPRVGDGFMRIEADWTISYASPNAVSAYHRLGIMANLVGRRVGALGIDERSVLERLARGEPVENEVESGGAWVLRRLLPLIRGGEVGGALVLVRDVTDLRRRDRMLLLKDATIREIHHRVKNNLQTVASLLRLQARRLSSVEAKEALEESVRRIASIALVHETLSQDCREWVDFDHVARRLLGMAQESLAGPERPLRFALLGSAGDLSSRVATPLALVFAELVHNAIEHAFDEEGGSVSVELIRAGRGLRVVVRDDGRGLPRGFTLDRGAGLGLQIVRTLVESELGGSIEISDEEGTKVEISVPIRPAEEGAGEL
ncbi:MAG: sensor histidine kinase [Acidobacteria bacterium]|nr:sensor histidine kinase [Acidobacteriota bacterium]